MQYPPTSFLGACDPSDIDALFASGASRAMTSGELLCREGDPGTQVFVVLGGFVKLTKVARNGRVTMLDLRGSGDVLGDMAIVDDQPQSANAIVLTDGEVLALASRRFDELLHQRVGIANALLGVVVRRLRQASSRQHELGTTEVVARVCARLVELADMLGEPHADGVLVRALSQQELADWAGVSRDGVVRALHELRDLGLLESGRGQLVLRDVPAIEKRAGRDGSDRG